MRELDPLILQDTVEQIAAIIQQVDEPVEFLAPHIQFATTFRNALNLPTIWAGLTSHDPEGATIYLRSASANGSGIKLTLAQSYRPAF